MRGHHLLLNRRGPLGQGHHLLSRWLLLLGCLVHDLELGFGTKGVTDGFGVEFLIHLLTLLVAVEGHTAVGAFRDLFQGGGQGSCAKGTFLFRGHGFQRFARLLCLEGVNLILVEVLIMSK